MESVTLGALDRTEAAFAAIDWELGGQPSWWACDSLVWQVQTAYQGRFATASLEQLAQRLAQVLREPLHEARRRLFLWAPLVADEQGELGPNGLTATAHLRHAYLRAQVVRLARLESSFTNFRTQVIGEVLALVATSAAMNDPADADRLLAADDPHFYLGVPLPTLKSWAKEFEAFEVSDFAAQAGSRVASRRAAEQARKTAASEEQARTDARWGERIREFQSYFDAPDFEPRDRYEEQAWALHRVMRAAASAAEEEHAMVERDRYLIDNVFRKVPT